MEYYIHDYDADAPREFKVEFASAAEVHKAWDIVLDYKDHNITGIFGAMPGMRWEYADEVIKDESNILFVICRPSDVEELRKKWAEA